MQPNPPTGQPNQGPPAGAQPVSLSKDQPASGAPAYYPGGYAPGGYASGYYPMYAPPYPRPYIDKNVGWFVANWIFLWPSALYSLLAHFVKIDEAVNYGDLAGAYAHAAAVKTIAKISVIVVGGAYAALFVLGILMATLVTTT